MVEWGRKSYLGSPEIISFSAGILAETISMKHYDMLCRMDISTFYFYELLLFQIFVPWKLIKT